MIHILRSMQQALNKRILFIIGVVCILYFIATTSFVGYLNVYNLIWIFIGAFFLVFYKFREKILILFLKTTKIIRLLIIIIVSIFSISFLALEVFIIRDAQDKKIENADYLVILGAGLNGSNPSLTLLRRINKAVEFLNENRETKVIISGGKGSRETVTEAEVMFKILQSNGIQESRIFMENQSTNTYENLAYSGNLINKNEKIVIVSSGFHLFRAKKIAEKMGYRNVEGIASKTPFLLVFNYYVREYFAVLKEFIVGNI